MRKADGWLEREGPRLRADYWLDPYSGESPILGYNDTGINIVQWFHPLHDKAILLVADGGWRHGATWHVWFSHGARTVPVDLTEHLWELDACQLQPGEPDWAPRWVRARDIVENYFGLAPAQRGE